MAKRKAKLTAQAVFDKLKAGHAMLNENERDALFDLVFEDESMGTSDILRGNLDLVQKLGMKVAALTACVLILQNKPPRRGPPADEKRNGKILDDYINRLSLEQLKRKYGISISTIRSILLAEPKRLTTKCNRILSRATLLTAKSIDADDPLAVEREAKRLADQSRKIYAKVLAVESEKLRRSV